MSERATKFDKDLCEAIVENGNRWGSHKDYVAEQIELARKDPGLFVFSVSDAGKRVAFRRPEGEPSSTPSVRLAPPAEAQILDLYARVASGDSQGASGVFYGDGKGTLSAVTVPVGMLEALALECGRTVYPRVSEKEPK